MISDEQVKAVARDAGFLSGVQEIVPYRLTDRLPLLANPTRFFQRGDGGLADTNLQGPGGALPSGNAMVVTGWGVDLDPPEGVRSVLGWDETRARWLWRRTATESIVSLWICAKLYQSIPARLLAVWSPELRSVTMISEWVSDNHILRQQRREIVRYGLSPIDPPLVILPTRPFAVELRRRASATDQLFRVRMILGGYLLREWC